MGIGEAQYSSYRVWSIAKCWCQGIITCRLTPRLVGIYSSIRGVLPSFQEALSKIKTHTFDDIRTFSCSVLSSSTINYAEQCQTAPDTIDTGSGSLIFINFKGVSIWWFEPTFTPCVRNWVILSDVKLLATELWYLLTQTMQKTLCHLFMTRGNMVGMS